MWQLTPTFEKERGGVVGADQEQAAARVVHPLCGVIKYKCCWHQKTDAKELYYDETVVKYMYGLYTYV